MTSPTRSTPPPAPPLTDAEQAVLDALRSTAFGEVEVTIHNARIVQIAHTRKTRLDPR